MALEDRGDAGIALEFGQGGADGFGQRLLLDLDGHAQRPQALAVAILLRAKNIVIAVIGGVLWAATERGKAAAANEQISPVVP